MNAWAVRLHDAIAGLAPIDGVSVNADHSVVRIDFKAEATQGQRDAANAAAAAFDWSPGAEDAWTASKMRTRSKKITASSLPATPAEAYEDLRSLRALASIVLDEINALRGWLSSFQGEVAAATSLADLKARVATLPAMPDRTVTQLRNAIDSKIDGDA